MKKIVLPFLLLSTLIFAQKDAYISAGVGVLAHKKTSAFNFDVAVGYQFKKQYILEANYISSNEISAANIVFGIENKSEKKILFSGFTGLGSAFYDKKSYLNYQLGVNMAYRIEKSSVVGLKVSNNINKAKTFTAMSLFYRYNF